MQTLNKETVLQILKREESYLRDKYGVERIALYGSFATNQQTKGSDIDILVQFSNPLGLKFIELANYLEAVLGRKVHLTTFATLSRNKNNQRYKQMISDIEGTLRYV